MNGTVTLSPLEFLAVACLPLGALSSVLKRVLVSRVEAMVGGSKGGSGGS